MGAERRSSRSLRPTATRPAHTGVTRAGRPYASGVVDAGHPAPLLSIVLPTRNEAANLPLLLDRLERALDQTAFEVCVVDDSDDDTPEVLERLARERPGRVRAVLRRGGERRGGLSTAVVAGLRLASGRWVAVMDADLQHPPETLPGMLAAAEAGADIVVASRYVAGGSSRGLDGVGRRVVSRLATALARALFREARRSRDPLSGFFLCRRQLVDGVEFRPVGFKILLELLVLLPEVVVRDVPLRFDRRAHGRSKATVAQGVQYLRHLRSLFLHVPGSARGWKFSLVGASGLAVFLPILWALADLAHWPAIAAFLPAFLLSLAWNTALNRVWTFADRRRRTAGEGLGRYLRWALLGGALTFAVFTAVYAAGLALLPAAVLGVLAGATVNAAANRRRITSHPVGWARVATDEGVVSALRRLAEQIGADRAYVVSADSARGGGVPGELLHRVVTLRRPALWTEASSFRPQRRSNIEEASLLFVPLVGADGEVSGVVVCERWAVRGFDPSALDTATRAVGAIATALLEATAAGPRPVATPHPARDAACDPGAS